jgi:hypothetical protein
MLRKFASFLKWRLVPVRYLGRLRFLNHRNIYVKYSPREHKAREIEARGYAEGPRISGELLAQLQEIYQARAEIASTKGVKAPFINLSRAEDFSVDSPLLQFAFSPQVLDVALDYYGQHCRLDKIQVLYSFPTESGSLKESQKWHLDYSDSRSFHCMTYLNDVLQDGDGPFVMLDKVASKEVGRGLIVRRIDDGQIEKESRGAVPIVHYGSAGHSILVDPAVCYHYGSRCVNARLAIFVTFSSDKPYVHAMSLARKNSAILFRAAKSIRPDLSEKVLKSVFDI